MIPCRAGGGCSARGRGRGCRSLGRVDGIVGEDFEIEVEVEMGGRREKQEEEGGWWRWWWWIWVEEVGSRAGSGEGCGVG